MINGVLSGLIVRRGKDGNTVMKLNMTGKLYSIPDWLALRAPPAIITSPIETVKVS